jgi:hypothetical protein
MSTDDRGRAGAMSMLPVTLVLNLARAVGLGLG